MAAEKLHFITTGFIASVKKLTPGTSAKWGKMNAQQMIEHVTGFFKVSSGELQFDLVTPEEHLPKFKEFLVSDKEFRENTKAPLTVIGEETLPLRHSNMEAAITALEKSIKEFVDHFAPDKNITTLHPVFGSLNFDEWVLLHYKHVMHHLKQFGLM